MLRVDILLQEFNHHKSDQNESTFAQSFVSWSKPSYFFYFLLLSAIIVIHSFKALEDLEFIVFKNYFQ